jgi:23S rRNA-/tRNA-specific pseudouridylate synthase
VRRSYVSLLCGLPSLTSGRVEIPIGRDPRDRKKMAAIPVSGGSSKSRTAASRWVFYSSKAIWKEKSYPIRVGVCFVEKG